ncbi:hypothetical protein SAMD00019534_095220 [Acytostelium subglobosum LB1]|uniref:hypothetical protein n=1 Tax=Acytostelium subglobosum LB1 TaxID=1410327 RepID=UPI00064493AC|nr:hypothetical protein SAMD00019534_095220 [Acytostelium subglobosum LB1]GAM26347.1 hypothetical protein SAMD00019534_095220 [Acytostelium subglobosum LB1]|eukprot:XP_012750901.1 hypothetical protein SAMD00019534_095220 [Acytostelium subglobosum LB1]
MQKFGVQTEKGKVIYCWKNADKYQVEGVRIVVHGTKYKNLDQLKVELNKKVGLYTGAVQRIYSAPDKKQIKTLEDFEDQQNYVCCGAEKLSEDVYAKGLVGIFGVGSSKPATATATTSTTTTTTAVPSVDSTAQPEKTPVITESIKADETTTTSTTSTGETDASKTSMSRRTPSPNSKKPVVSSYTDGVPQPFKIGTEKAKVIRAFRNSDKVHGGERITIHATKFKTYDQLKEHLSSKVCLVTGPVRKVFSFDGKQVKTMDDFMDGQNYICCGGEPVNLEINRYKSDMDSKQRCTRQVWPVIIIVL